MSQFASFKTDVISTNLDPDENASVKVVVDEIWSTYDVDNSGTINRDEARNFVKTYMPEFQPGFVFKES